MTLFIKLMPYGSDNCIELNPNHIVRMAGTMRDNKEYTDILLTNGKMLVRESIEMIRSLSNPDPNRKGYNDLRGSKK